MPYVGKSGTSVDTYGPGRDRCWRRAKTRRAEPTTKVKNAVFLDTGDLSSDAEASGGSLKKYVKLVNVKLGFDPQYWARVCDATSWPMARICGRFRSGWGTNAFDDAEYTPASIGS